MKCTNATFNSTKPSRNFPLVSTRNLKSELSLRYHCSCQCVCVLFHLSNVLVIITASRLNIEGGKGNISTSSNWVSKQVCHVSFHAISHSGREELTLWSKLCAAYWHACQLLAIRVSFRSQNLPVEEIYSPALNIRVRDNRSFGRQPIVGVHSLRSIQKYRCPTPKAVEETDSGAKGPAPKGMARIRLLI